METKATLSTCLWFSSNAVEAANFYTSIFKDGEILRTTYYGSEGKEIHGMDEGTVLTVEYTILGNKFMNLNGGDAGFKFNEAISIVVSCDTQEEVDYYWDKLSEGGDPKAQQCGWLKDKYGLSWQVAPRILDELIASHDRETAGKAMNAMMKMKKIEIRELKDAVGWEVEE